MKKLIFIIIFALLLSMPCLAAPYDSSKLHDALPDSADDIVGSAETDPVGSLDKLWSSVKAALTGGISDALRRSMGIVAIAAMCAAFGVFAGNAPEYVTLGACAAVSVISANAVSSFISEGREVIDALCAFSKVLLPAMCAASAACGTISSASVRYAASVMFMDGFVTLARSVIQPIIYAYLAAGIAAASFGGKMTDGIAKLLKRCCTVIMSVAALGFTAYISISSAVASGGDAIATKVAKSAISTALPVVGGIISNAASTVVAAAQVVRNTVGVFGMLALLAVCLAPMAVMALNYLCYKLTAAAVKAFGCERLSKLTNSIAGAVGMMLGLVGCCAIILFISAAVSVKGVTG